MSNVSGMFCGFLDVGVFPDFVDSWKTNPVSILYTLQRDITSLRALKASVATPHLSRAFL